MHQAKTETIITALRNLADKIHSDDDGATNAAIRGVADLLTELHATATRQCVWTPRADMGTGAGYRGACGIEWWIFGGGGPRKNDTNYCPRCGGRVKLAKRPE